MKFTRGIPFFRLVLCLVALAAVAVLPGVPTRTVQAAFPGSNGQISFGLFNPNIGDTQVWVSNPDGSSPILLTPQSGSEISDWSADGSKVAFDFSDGQTSQIGTINPDATGFLQLTTEENVFSAQPAWSPDGKRIAIFSDGGDFPAGVGIYTIDASTQGSTPSRVTANPFHSLDQNPHWSPNGEWIVFTRLKVSAVLPRNSHAPGGVSALFLVHPDGTGLHQLTQWGLSADEADWSPDGSTIVFVNTENLPIASDIYTIRVDGSGLKMIVNSGVLRQGGGVGHPHWSPDGTKIIFDGTFGGSGVTPAEVSLFTVNPDGSDLTAISAFSGRPAFFPAWGKHPLQ